MLRPTQGRRRIRALALIGIALFFSSCGGDYSVEMTVAPESAQAGDEVLVTIKSDADDYGTSSTLVLQRQGDRGRQTTHYFFGASPEPARPNQAVLGNHVSGGLSREVRLPNVEPGQYRISGQAFVGQANPEVSASVEITD